MKLYHLVVDSSANGWVVSRLSRVLEAEDPVAVVVGVRLEVGMVVELWKIVKLDLVLVVAVVGAAVRVDMQVVYDSTEGFLDYSSRIY
ncbi:hypothetical protein AgCh_004920 [Apium graveolens]